MAAKSYDLNLVAKLDAQNVNLGQRQSATCDRHHFVDRIEEVLQGECLNTNERVLGAAKSKKNLLTVTLSAVTNGRMNDLLSIDALAERVQFWCSQHRVIPANGQAAEALTQRTIRYYRTLGLLDAPVSGEERGFTEKHRLQLIAVRLLQAHGLPLRRIRELLYGLDENQLREMERRGIADLGSHQGAQPKFAPSGAESWQVTPMEGGFLLVSREAKQLSASILRRINDLILDSVTPTPNPSDN